MPSNITVTTPTDQPIQRITRQAASVVALDPIKICILDDLGNVVSQTSSLSVTIRGFPIFEREQTITIPNGCSTITPVLDRAVAGSHIVEIFGSFASSSPSSYSYSSYSSDSSYYISRQLAGNLTLSNIITLNVDIAIGSPSKIIYQGSTSFDGLPDHAIDGARIVVTDGAGNQFNTNDTKLSTTEGLQVRVIEYLPAVALIQGDNATISNGVARFPTLSFQGIHGRVYRLTFALESQHFDRDNSRVDVNITLLECQQVKPFSVPNANGYDCQCSPGYTVTPTDNNGDGESCLPCEINNFKAFSGNNPCVPCEAKKDTFGRRGQPECVCDRGNR